MAWACLTARNPIVLIPRPRRSTHEVQAICRDLGRVSVVSWEAIAKWAAERWMKAHNEAGEKLWQDIQAEHQRQQAIEDEIKKILND